MTNQRVRANYNTQFSLRLRPPTKQQMDHDESLQQGYDVTSHGHCDDPANENQTKGFHRKRAKSSYFKTIWLQQYQS